MSERGSFVTEYVYCGECFEHLKSVLLENEKHLCSRVFPSWEQDGELPIIAGKIGDTYRGGEGVTFDTIMRRDIEEGLCHSIRIAVLPEGEEYSAILVFTPQKDNPDRMPTRYGWDSETNQLVELDALDVKEESRILALEIIKNQIYTAVYEHGLSFEDTLRACHEAIDAGLNNRHMNKKREGANES